MNYILNRIVIDETQSSRFNARADNKNPEILARQE